MSSRCASKDYASNRVTHTGCLACLPAPLKVPLAAVPDDDPAVREPASPAQEVKTTPGPSRTPESLKEPGTPPHNNITSSTASEKTQQQQAQKGEATVRLTLLHIGGRQRKDGWTILDSQAGPMVDVVSPMHDLKAST